MARRGVRRLLAAVAFLAATLFSSVLLAPSAFAHATLSSSNPADGARLDAVPDQVELAFSEPVGLASGYLRVTDENGDQVDDGSPESDGGRVAVGLREDVADGSFLVSYRLISTDSHPIAGALAFVVGDGPLVAATDAQAGSSSDPVVSAVFSVVRWLSYAGLVLLVGPLVIAALSWSAARTVPALRRLFRLGLVVSLGVAALSVVVQALNVSGRPLTGLLSIDLPAILGSTYGVAMLVRIALITALALQVRWTFAQARAELDSGISTAPAVFLAGGAALLGIALTYSASGHPIGSRIPALSVLSDAVHVLAMAIWLGGLVVLVLGLLPQHDTGLLARVLPRFSTLALICIGALLISGSVQAVLEISPLAALWSTTYGLLVTLKVIGLAVLVALGNAARTWVRSRYDGPDGPDDEPDAVLADAGSVAPGPVPDGGNAAAVALAERRARPESSTYEGLRRSLLLEVGVAAVVLGLAAVLVATVPARTSYSAPFAESIALPDGGSVDVTVEPARSGLNLMHIYLLDDSGQPLEVLEVTASAELAAQEIGPLEIPLQPTGPSHYTATGFSFPVAGLWELRVAIRLGEFDASSVTTEVPVS